MRQIKLFFILLTVILFAVTCKKEHVPTPTTQTPVFYFNGMVNGISTSLDAGINNYYMYSSYTQDSSTHVYSFIGNLKQTNSNLNGIEIDINDNKVSVVNATTQPDSALGLVNYSYYSVGVTDTVYKVSFSSSYMNGTAQTYSWSFGDGTTSNVANPIHSYNSTGNYNVCLTISGGSCSNSICNLINVGVNSGLAKNANVTSSANYDSVSFVVTSTGFVPYKFHWNFGDGTQDSVIQTNYITHVYSSSGTYPVVLTITDSINSNSITTNYNAITANSTGCTANYSLDSINQVITTGTTLRLSDVTIKWTDAAGIVYTTNNNAAQPSSSYFKIVSEEAYQGNRNGQSTRKLHVKFTCTLYNGASSIQITNADAIIAVAYK